MNLGDEHALQEARRELQSAQAELEELRQQIHSFEAQVDATFGSLLDQLSTIRSEISFLNDTLHQIREQRLFGKDRIRILSGAPIPPRPGRWEEPTVIEGFRPSTTSMPDDAAPSAQSRLPNIKQIYRLLARRYHPDLARSEAERLELNERMAEINQFYREEDLNRLMDLAGMEVPFYLKLSQAQTTKIHQVPLTELEQMQLETKEVQLQISRLSKLPSVKLSLEVKLAGVHGRDLLAEMADDLKRRLERKLAERDYLQAQVQASQVYSEDG